jgi:anti-sigma factor RsiW
MAKRTIFPRWRRRGGAPGGLTCRELVELVTDYLENALPAADRARFEAHIAACDGCTAYLEQMRMTLRTLGRVEPESLSDSAARELAHAFRDWRSGRDGG